jgi:hypothetical protein
MRVLLFLCATISVAIPVHAATFNLPSIPHYEFEVPILPQPSAPPRYTEHYEQSEAARTDKDDSGDEPESRWKSITEDPVALATLLLAGVTGILAASTFGLWCVTRRSVRVLETIERPYFLLEQLADFDVREEQIHRVYVTYFFTNIGRTPAIVDDLKADFVYSTEPPLPLAQYQFKDSTVRLHDRVFRSNDGFTEELPALISGLNFIYQPYIYPNER